MLLSPWLGGACDALNRRCTGKLEGTSALKRHPRAGDRDDGRLDRATLGSCDCRSTHSMSSAWTTAANRQPTALVRWECRYGWTRRGYGRVERETSLANTLARFLEKPRPVGQRRPGRRGRPRSFVSVLPARPSGFPSLRRRGEWTPSVGQPSSVRFALEETRHDGATSGRWRRPCPLTG